MISGKPNASRTKTAYSFGHIEYKARCANNILPDDRLKTQEVVTGFASMAKILAFPSGVVSGTGDVEPHPLTDP
jgi:hypothetical protein